MRNLLIFTLVLGALCDSGYKLVQTVRETDSAVEGIGIAHNQDYVALGSFYGSLYLFQKNTSGLNLMQKISDDFGIVWGIDMTDDHWVGVAADDHCAVYNLTTNNKFQLVAQLDTGYGNEAIQITNDHQHLALGKDNCDVIIYTLNNWSYEQVQVINWGGSVTDDCRVWSLSLTKDGKWLAVGRVGSVVQVFRNVGGQFRLNTTVNIPDGGFARVKLTNDHNWFVVGTRENGHVLVYHRNGSDLVLKQNISDIDSVYSLDLTNDGKEMVLSCSDSSYVYAYDGYSFNKVQTLTPSEPNYYHFMSTKISSNHNSIYIGSTSSSLFVYQKNQSGYQLRKKPLFGLLKE